MTQTNLDLWPIGNCQASALIDRAGRFVWACVPRVDGDPVFSALIDNEDYEAEAARGFWAIELEGCVSVTQHYLRNTPVLVNLGAVLTNPVAVITFPHQILACFMVAGAFVAAVAGWHLVRMRRRRGIRSRSRPAKAPAARSRDRAASRRPSPPAAPGPPLPP